MRITLRCLARGSRQFIENRARLRVEADDVAADITIPRRIIAGGLPNANNPRLGAAEAPNTSSARGRSGVGLATNSGPLFAAREKGDLLRDRSRRNAAIAA